MTVIAMKRAAEDLGELDSCAPEIVKRVRAVLYHR